MFARPAPNASNAFEAERAFKSRSRTSCRARHCSSPRNVHTSQPRRRRDYGISARLRRGRAAGAASRRGASRRGARARRSLLVLTNLLNYVDRGVIPGASGEFTSFVESSREFDGAGASAAFGALTSAFIVGYSVACVVVGHLVHHRSPFKMTGVGLVLWCVAAVLAALAKPARSYTVLLLARMLSGVGEAGFVTVGGPFIQDAGGARPRGRRTPSRWHRAISGGWRRRRRGRVAAPPRGATWIFRGSPATTRMVRAARRGAVVFRNIPSSFWRILVRPDRSRRRRQTGLMARRLLRGDPHGHGHRLRLRRRDRGGMDVARRVLLRGDRDAPAGVRAPRGYVSDESRRRRGRDVESPWRRSRLGGYIRRGIAAAPRPRRGESVETGTRLGRETGPQVPIL